MDIASVFNIAAKDYDATRKKYISCFDDLYGVALDCVPYRKNDYFKVLDLGAGTGLFSAIVRNSFPSCEMTLTDISNEMLEKAKERFSNHERINFIQHDYINEQIHGKFDVVISALSLHHSTQKELSSIFGKLFLCLNAGGIFINADQILGRNPEIETAYEEAWLNQAKSNGCTEL
ncbi:MAG: class I SAM-dependent methyltransferase [Pseudomonadota bacterium]